MNNYVVYKHICPNGKVYIGITQRKPEKRWNNGNGYKKNKHFYNAIKKYKWENIEHEIIKSNISNTEAYKLEKELIKKYKSNDRNFGYNNSIGGENSALGFRHSKESKEKIKNNNSKYWKGKHLPNDIKEKISQKNKGRFVGEDNPFYGKHHTKETIEKNRQAHLGKVAWNKGTKGIMKANQTSFKKGEIHSFTKKVKCIETKIIYNTINDASRKTNISATCIINVCKGKQKVAGKLHWKYV